MKIRVIYILLLSCSYHYSISQVTNSVLNSGLWYKIGVLEKGIYKIDKPFLEKLGINSDDIDPRNLALYGNGGNGMLPQSNSAFRYADLIENSVYFEGENDGSFDATDYLLFLVILLIL